MKMCTNKSIAAAVSMAALAGVLSLSGCGNVAATGSADPV